MHPPSSAAVSTSTIPGVLDIFFEIFLEASSIAATPAFMSDDPRPYSRSPCVSPANGSRVHARAPSGTTSRCPVRHSGAFEGDPPARAITLVRPSAYSWYSTRKPHCSRSAPACRAQSRSRPGGLTVSKRSSERVRAMASCSLMRTDDTSPIPLTGFTRTHTIPSPYPERRGARMFPTQRRTVLAAVLAAFACTAIAHQQPAAKGGKHHQLPATLETVQWGWLDPKEPPKLTINSGDTVSIETMMHAHNKVQQGITMEQIIELRKANPGGGPHSMTGPIYVNGAEPGDVMEIRILKIVPRSFGISFNLPGKDFPTVGALAPEMPEGFIKFWSIDPAQKTAEFKPGIMVELQPFPGTLAVGIDPNDPSPRKGGVKDDPMAPVSTLRPWKNGSNMDINELQAGSKIFFPVFLKGGLIWTGDSHCRQGNGEVSLTALECAYREIVIQPIVRKDMKTEWPRMETATHWIMMGFDESLDEAMKIATRETVKFLAEQKMVPMSRAEAYLLASVVGDCRVSQVVDIRKGVHCMIPKNIFTRK